METLKEDGREQTDDAAFYWVETKYGQVLHPVDEHAVYGFVPRDEEFDVPVRNALRDRTYSIDALREGDRIRVNGGGWMAVTGRAAGGATAIYENGEVEYVLWARHTPERINVEPGPRMFRRNPWGSEGHISYLEVDWRAERALRG